MEVSSIPKSAADTALPAPAQSSVGEESADDLRGRIVGTLRKLSPRAQPPSNWARFGTTKSLRCLGDEASFLPALSDHFTRDELIASRVAMQTEKGELRASPLFVQKPNILIQWDAESRPADIVTQRGTLSTGAPEWCDLAARTTDGHSAHEAPVVLGDDAELFVTSCLGIACSPSGGIAELTGSQVRELFGKRAKQAERRAYQLILIGWSCEAMALAPQPTNLAAIRHVAEIEPTFKLDPKQIFSVWVPSEAELARMRRAHSFADSKVLAVEFKGSLKKSVYAPADALKLIAGRKPVAWPEARVALESVVDRSIVVPRASEANEAIAILEKAYRDLVLRPLERTGGKSGIEALHSLLSADLARVWFSDLEVVVAARRIIAGRSPNFEKRIDDAVLDRKLKLIIAFTKLARFKFGK